MDRVDQHFAVGAIRRRDDAVGGGGIVQRRPRGKLEVDRQAEGQGGIAERGEGVGHAGLVRVQPGGDDGFRLQPARRFQHRQPGFDLRVLVDARDLHVEDRKPGVGEPAFGFTHERGVMHEREGLTAGQRRHHPHADRIVSGLRCDGEGLGRRELKGQVRQTIDAGHGWETPV